MRLYISAGEPSGDAHAAGVVRALERRLGNRLTVEALGGPALMAAGAVVRDHIDGFGVMGFTEVLGRIPAHLRLFRRLRRDFQTRRYDLVLLVDYPGFHLHVGRAARAAGIPVLYYVAPQFWAWRPQRVERLRRAADRVAAILPFEVPFLEERGIRAEFVGHPFRDDGTEGEGNREAARRAMGIPSRERVLAILPGSRRQEVRLLWPRFRDAATILLERGVCDRVLVAARPDLTYPGTPSFSYHPAGKLVLAAANAALVKSGSVTIEAALADTPMVVAYRVGRLSAALARRLLQVQWISLVNLIAGGPVVPERTQDAVTVAGLVDALTPLLHPGSLEAAEQRRGFAVVRSRLGAPGASERVAQMAMEMIAA